MIKNYNIAIAGAGFAGGIVARQLRKYTSANVTVIDKCDDIEASDSGTGLNINPNGMNALRSIDAGLERNLRACGLPRKSIKAETSSGEQIYNEPIFDDDGNGLALNTGLRVRWADA